MCCLRDVINNNIIIIKIIVTLI